MAKESQMNTTIDFRLCPKFEQTFQMLGKKWNGLIIETLLVNGPQRFKCIANVVSKCSDRVLVERLKELEEDGVITRKTFCDSSLIQYELTEKGEALEPIMKQIHDWSDQWCDIND
ncbi:winged helix-turn-helix transcriptional regulator [Apilactobacillus zhangqiuensis]|uniref:winged helix-turn-helix transcriptional regulator n=1 Tax=Apilactobacillus zhangqiuensis TaxID=2841031 RepID=UPI001C7CF293|nr:helix-turn-helix domain-containing protein [Apilactobacillus zhangqiuensis]